MLKRTKQMSLITTLAVINFLVLPAKADEKNINDMSLEELLNIPIVTATMKEQKLKDVPASVTVVTHDEINKKGYRFLKDIMNDVPGFNDVSDVNEEVVAVRGVYTSTTNKILILIDGHRMNDLMNGKYNTDQFLGLDTVERVEFVRGPGSAVFGTGALIGVVNVITKKGKDVNGFYTKVKGGLYSRELSTTWGEKIGNLDIISNFSFLDAPGQVMPQLASKDVVPTGQTKKDGNIYLRNYPQNWSGMANLSSDDTSLKVRASHFSRITPRGSNGSFYDLNTQPFPPNYTENDFFADFSHTFTIGSENSKLIFNPSFHYFNYFDLSTLSYGANRVPPIGDGFSGTENEMRLGQLKLTYENQLLDNLNLIAGIDTMLSNFYRSDSMEVSSGKMVLTPNGYTETGNWFLFGALAQAIWKPFDFLGITGGGRFDTFGGEAPPKFSPRIGITYNPLSSFNAKLLYSNSYMAPMWAHTRRNNELWKGSKDLTPEKFNGAEMILMYNNESNFSTELNAYYNIADGIINSVKETVDGKSITKYKNTGKSLYMGFDLSAKYSIFEWLKLNGTYSFIAPDAANTTPSLLDSGSILNIPAHTIRYGLSVLPVKNLNVTFWGRTYSEVKTTDTVTKKTTIPWVPLFDLSVDYTFKDINLFDNTVKDVFVQVLANNLTNQYYEIGGISAEPLARQGFSLEGTLGVKF